MSRPLKKRLPPKLNGLLLEMLKGEKPIIIAQYNSPKSTLRFYGHLKYWIRTRNITTNYIIMATQRSGCRLVAVHKKYINQIKGKRLILTGKGKLRWELILK